MDGEVDFSLSESRKREKFIESENKSLRWIAFKSPSLIFKSPSLLFLTQGIAFLPQPPSSALSGCRVLKPLAPARGLLDGGGRVHRRVGWAPFSAMAPLCRGTTRRDIRRGQGFTVHFGVGYPGGPFTARLVPQNLGNGEKPH